MAVKLPVSYKDFVKSPLKAITYMSIVGLVGLFIYLQMSNKNEKDLLAQQIVKCEERVATEQRINIAQNLQMDSIKNVNTATLVRLSKIESKLETLKELKILQ